ncbi:MAG TPA: DMT family transporter [Dehalococcoidales bacterium]|nr:DMT family transporter [Dehalococcoidales bacterium]
MLRNWKSSPVFALIALVAVTAIWGWTFLIVKVAIARMPVMDFLALRFTVATIVMVAIRPTILRRISRRQLWRGAILGALLGLAYVTQTYGLRSTSAAVSGFITGMAVVFTPIVSWLLLRNVISLKTWLAVVLACAGLALLSLHGWAFGTGELLTLGCALFLAFHITGLGKWSSQHESYGLALIQIATVAVMSLVAAAPGGFTLPPDAEVWGIIGITAVLATSVAFLVQTWAQSLISPTHAAVILTMEPVFAGIFAVVIGGEHLTPRIIGGAVCVLAAMFLIQLKFRQRGR